MKSTAILFLTLFIGTTVYTQNCKVLDKASFFRDIKFGQPPPPSLISICAKDWKIDSDYQLNFESSDSKCKKKYANLFTLFSQPFSNLILISNEKGQICSVDLWSFLDDSTGKVSANNQPPAIITKLYNKMLKLYGQPTTRDNNVIPDSSTIKYSGISKIATWTCNDIELELRFTYGSIKNFTNKIRVNVTNRNFEPVPSMEKIQQ